MNSWRSIRSKILTPNVSATMLDVRGFHKKSPAAQELLEKIGSTFLTGYGYAAEARSPAAAEDRLEEIPSQFRGFCYEGAGMGFAMLDALPFGDGHDNIARFLGGRGNDHIYMVYVGIGWAMARLPRFRWPKIAPLDPLLRWLVLDGYGFHQAYFHTDRYVTKQFQDPGFRWADGPASYPNRVIDQGIGRAMWFVGGTDAELVATMIDRFPESRRSDLYSGAGLAATYAGGAGEAELRLFGQRAGIHRPQVALACAFAAEARVRAGLVMPNTEMAAEVFCGMTAHDAARLTQDVRPTGPVAGELPAFEVWRERIANEFVSPPTSSHTESPSEAKS